MTGIEPVLTKIGAKPFLRYEEYCQTFINVSYLIFVRQCPYMAIIFILFRYNIILPIMGGLLNNGSFHKPLDC